MSQVLHIFRKDVRHFWREIILSWCLLGIFVWQAARKWNPEHPGGVESDLLQIGFQFSALLLVLSWWTLLIRLVHDERLVGDRQFWVTRPYRWVELLVEKAIFTLVFINVPLLLAQLLMLKLAAFPAFPYLAGLLEIQAAFTMTLLLAVFLLAIVTATFAQVILAALMAALYLFGHSAVISEIPNSSMSHASSALDLLAGLLLVCAIVAVILLQYWKRRTLVSRSIIVATAVVITLVPVVTPYQALIAKQYPRIGSGQVSPLRIALDTKKPEKPPGPPGPARQPPKPEKKINISIPLLASATNDGDIVAPDGIRVSFDLPNGRRWQSNWQSQWNAIIIPETPSSLSFELPKDVFELVKSTPTRIDVEMALSVYRRGGEQWQVVAQEDNFSAPELGICSGSYNPDTGIHCRAPLHRPGRLLATANSSESTCPVLSEEKSEKPAPNVIGYYSNLYVSGQGGGALINPVVEEMIYFRPINLRRQEDWKFSPRICPGTPMYFTSVDFVRRTSMVTSLEGIRLPDYRLGNAYVGAVFGLGAVAGSRILP